VYKLVNTVTGKGYVGQTIKKDIGQRMSGHKNAHRFKARGCRLLNNSIRKHGWQAFEMKVIGKATVGPELDALEEHMIAHHGTLTPNGYNLLSGPSVVPMHEPAVRAKRAATMRTPEARKRLSDGVKAARARIGTKWTEGTTKARRERASRERARKMAGMTAKEQEKYLKYLAGANASKKRKKAARTLASSASKTTRTNTNGETLLTRWLHSSGGAGSSKDVDALKSRPLRTTQVDIRVRFNIKTSV